MSIEGHVLGVCAGGRGYVQGGMSRRWVCPGEGVGMSRGGGYPRCYGIPTPLVLTPSGSTNSRHPT